MGRAERQRHGVLPHRLPSLRHPAYQDKIPYNVSLVDLQEGGRLVTNVIGCAPEEVKIGMPVEVVFEDFPEYTLPKFRRVK